MNSAHPTTRLFLAPEVEEAIRPLGGLVLALMRGDDSDETFDALGIADHGEGALLLASMRMLAGLLDSLARQCGAPPDLVAERWALALAK